MSPTDAEIATQVLKEEGTHRFPSFTASDAVTLGLSLRKRFRSSSRHLKGKGLVLSIQSISGHNLFSCTVGDLGHPSGIGDVSLDSWTCLEGMMNIVRRTGHTSYYVEKSMSAMGVVGIGKALPGGVGLDQVGLGGVGVGFGGASLGMGVPGVGMGTGGAMVSETPARIAGGAYPIWLENAPCCPIGVVAVYSGSSQDDHQLVSTTVRDYIDKMRKSSATPEEGAANNVFMHHEPDNKSLREDNASSPLATTGQKGGAGSSSVKSPPPAPSQMAGSASGQPVTEPPTPTNPITNPALPLARDTGDWSDSHHLDYYDNDIPEEQSAPSRHRGGNETESGYTSNHDKESRGGSTGRGGVTGGGAGSGVPASPAPNSEYTAESRSVDKRRTSTRGGGSENTYDRGHGTQGGSGGVGASQHERTPSRGGNSQYIHERTSSRGGAGRDRGAIRSGGKLGGSEYYESERSARSKGAGGTAGEKGGGFIKNGGSLAGGTFGIGGGGSEYFERSTARSGVSGRDGGGRGGEVVESDYSDRVDGSTVRGMPAGSGGLGSAFGAGSTTGGGFLGSAFGGGNLGGIATRIRDIDDFTDLSSRRDDYSEGYQENESHHQQVQHHGYAHGEYQDNDLPPLPQQQRYQRQQQERSQPQQPHSQRSQYSQHTSQPSQSQRLQSHGVTPQQTGQNQYPTDHRDEY